MHVTYMNFYNTNVAPQVIVLYISPRGGGNATEIRRMALNRFEHYVVRERIPLAADDEIQADTNTASAVKYIVGGETNA